MTPEQKEKFIIEYTNRIQKGILQKIRNIPENWEGLEIKHWIELEFKSEIGFSDPKRKKNFENDLLVNHF